MTKILIYIICTWHTPSSCNHFFLQFIIQFCVCFAHLANNSIKSSEIAQCKMDSPVTNSSCIYLVYLGQRNSTEHMYAPQIQKITYYSCHTKEDKWNNIGTAGSIQNHLYTFLATPTTDVKQFYITNECMHTQWELTLLLPLNWPEPLSVL